MTENPDANMPGSKFAVLIAGTDASGCGVALKRCQMSLNLLGDKFVDIPK